MPSPVPRTIMFQRKRANRRIMNEDRFVDMLREFGEVRALMGRGGWSGLTSRGPAANPGCNP